MRLELPTIEKILKDRGICDYGKVQMAVDEDVIKYDLDYCPWLTGELANSPYQYKVGEGEITYSAYGTDGYNYAQYQYYLITLPENYSNQNGLRGNMWFDRMKADHIEDIIRHAQRVLDGGI